jgi:nucleotide-binding universal stress UspA family protein
VAVAAVEAARRGHPLRILHVLQPETVGMLPRPRYRPGAISGAAELLAQAADLARDAAGIDADTEVLFGDPADELVDRSARVELMVVGRGNADPLHTVLGSTAMGLMTHAQCPVLVVGDAPADADGGRVVVGVDGREESAEALELAFAEAQLRAATLVAVHAWHFPRSSGPGDMLPLVYAPDELERDEAAVLEDAVRPFRERYPSVPVTQLTAETSPTRALVEATAGARMLVLGSRGRGPVKGLLLGSVGQWAVRHAPCPVLIAHTRKG